MHLRELCLRFVETVGVAPGGAADNRVRQIFVNRKIYVWDLLRSQDTRNQSLRAQQNVPESLRRAHCPLGHSLKLRRDKQIKHRQNLRAKIVFQIGLLASLETGRRRTFVFALQRR